MTSVSKITTALRALGFPNESSEAMRARPRVRGVLRAPNRIRVLAACAVSTACSAGAPTADAGADLDATGGAGNHNTAGAGSRLGVVVSQGGSGGPSDGTGGTGAATVTQPGASGASAAGGNGTACAVDTQKAQLSPVNIVFVYDKSGSMGNTDDGFDPAARWNPMQAGMAAFFSDPSSSSISAALSFFPVNGDLTTACNGPYDNPQAANPRGVPLTPLDSEEGRNSFVSLLANTKPQGGTPTLPALRGGVQLARKIAADHPGAKTVVVLVTDGEPGFFVDGQVVEGCADNDVAHVAQVAADALAGSPSIPTYVVGIGPSLDSIQTIAEAGGTSHATIMSDADPVATSATFHETLAAIRTETFSCDFPMPNRPPGQTFESVNVAFKSSAGSEATIPRNDACSPGGGWHYDVANAPTKIVLCQESCDQIQPDPQGQLSVYFGCATAVR